MSELPWWTEDELQSVAAIDDFVCATSNYYDVPGTIDESPIKYNSYKADVLDKVSHIRLRLQAINK